ncbi:MAG: hypothetical protein FD181_3847 [Prolixibacteraceae bacterium]|nr:MAG: hypothetical protein FD181_3847 [Prolixibacteraceae bacterium]
MENITSTAELREAIQILETEQAEHLDQVREKFYHIWNSFSPANIIGSSLKGIVSSPNLVNNILGVAVGLFTGYLSRKAMFAGVTNSKYRRIFGNVLQFGIASLVARGPKVIKSFKQFIAQRIFRKKAKK